MRIVLSLLLSCTFFFYSYSQSGYYKVGFPSPDNLLTRDSVIIYLHIPPNHNPNTPSKLIIGNHGLGDPNNSEQIRTYLTGAADSINAILMCPDPYLQDQPRSSLTIDIAIDSIKTWYNIDTNEMYMAGYSAGSDVAAQYILQDPKHKMKGLIWFAPGFYSRPVLYNQQTFPPTCLCYGDQDPVSNLIGQVTSIIDSFATTSFHFYYNEIPGVAHTMNFPAITREILECIEFIDDPENFITDIDNPETTDFLKIYPNPLSQYGVLTYTLKKPENIKINLLDMSGKILTTLIEAYHEPGVYTQSLNELSTIPAGMYLVELKGSTGHSVVKMTISGQ